MIISVCSGNTFHKNLHKIESNIKTTNEKDAERGDEIVLLLVTKSARRTVPSRRCSSV